MVEGLLDAAVAQSRGLTEVVAYVGGQPSYAQLRTLHRHGVSAVTICPDPDAGGDAGILSFLKNLDHSIRAYVAPELPEGKDPDEVIVEHGVEGWRRHIAQSIRGPIYRASSILQEHDLSSANERDDALEELTRYAADLPERDLDDIVGPAAEPLRLQPSTLRTALVQPAPRIGGALAPDDHSEIHSAETYHLARLCPFGSKRRHVST